jgi:hypothetical protein
MLASGVALNKAADCGRTNALAHTVNLLQCIRNWQRRRKEPGVIGTRVDHWVLEAERGRGAMGTVYRGVRPEAPTPPIALKMLATELVRAPEFVERFRREIEILRQLNHPHIVRFLNAGTHDAVPYFVMEFIDGPDLEEYLRQRKRIPWPEVLDIASQVTQALKHAHERGILHRDLKPSNLLRAADGTIKLSDFGLAKLFAKSPQALAGSMVGTVAFLAPECASGKPVTKRSDLYALGGVLYNLLTGRPPFVGRTVVELVHKHCHTSPDRPSHWVADLPHELEELVLRLLAKKPSERPGDANEVFKALQHVRGRLERKGALTPRAEVPDSPKSDVVAEHAAWSAATAPLPPRYRGWLERPIVVGLLLLAVVGTLAYTFLRPRPTPTEVYARVADWVRSDSPADWDRAWDELLTLDNVPPESPAGQALDELRQKRRDWASLQAALTAPERPMPPAERFYQLGLRYAQVGDYASARRVWSAVVQAFPETEQPRWSKLAQRGLAGLPAANADVPDPKVPADVQHAIARGRELRAAGQPGAAEQLWLALEQLYRNEPGGAAVLAALATARGP